MMPRICLNSPERGKKISGKTWAKRDWEILKLLNLSGRYTAHFTIHFIFVYVWITVTQNICNILSYSKVIYTTRALQLKNYIKSLGLRYIKYLKTISPHNHEHPKLLSTSHLLISSFYFYFSLPVSHMTAGVIFLKHKPHDVNTLFKLPSGFPSHIDKIESFIEAYKSLISIASSLLSNFFFIYHSCFLSLTLITLGSLLLSQLSQVYSCLRTFAHNIPSSRNILPLNSCLVLSLPSRVISNINPSENSFLTHLSGRALNSPLNPLTLLDFVNHSNNHLCDVYIMFHIHMINISFMKARTIFGSKLYPW